jgi:hypothetical protein
MPPLRYAHRRDMGLMANRKFPTGTGLRQTASRVCGKPLRGSAANRFAGLRQTASRVCGKPLRGFAYTPSGLRPAVG